VNKIKSFVNQETVTTSSPILKLNPFIDDHSILRVVSRLRESSLPYVSKHPMLLPELIHFPILIIIHEHVKHLHAGPQATLAAIRERYWLTAARGSIRQMLRKCVTCFKSSPKSASTIMGNLPKSRVKSSPRIFDHVEWIMPDPSTTRKVQGELLR